MSMPPATTATEPVAERSDMRRRVDAAGHAGDDDDALPRRARRRSPGRGGGHWPRRCARRPPRPSARAEEFGLAEHGQHRRRVLDGCERVRVERLAPADEAPADAFDRGQFRSAASRRVATATAAPREPRHRVERGARPSRSGATARRTLPARRLAAARRSQSRRSCGSSSRAARAPQPFPKEIRLSVPAIRRRMLS